MLYYNYSFLVDWRKTEQTKEKNQTDYNLRKETPVASASRRVDMPGGGDSKMHIDSSLEAPNLARKSASLQTNNYNYIIYTLDMGRIIVNLLFTIDITSNYNSWLKNKNPWQHFESKKE